MTAAQGGQAAEVGRVTQRIHEDGKTVTFSKPAENGLILTMTMSWSMPWELDMHLDTARQGFAERDWRKTVVEAGQSKRVRKLGPFWFAVLSGPPTWWLPRIKVTRKSVMVGWLRRGLVLS